MTDKIFEINNKPLLHKPGTKIFVFDDVEYVPCFQHDGPNTLNAEPLILDDIDTYGITEEEWFDICGLIYWPKCLFKLDLVTTEYLVAWKIERENAIPAITPVVIGDDTNPIEPHNLNGCESKREKANPANRVDSIMELIHKRGQQTHRLGIIDSEIAQLEKEFSEKIEKLKSDQGRCIEIIDTYDHCLKLYFKEEGNGESN